MCKPSEAGGAREYGLFCQWGLAGGLIVALSVVSCTAVGSGNGPGISVATPSPSVSAEPTPRPQPLQALYDVSWLLAKGVSALGHVSSGFVRTADSGGLWQADTFQVQALATQSFVPAGFPFVYGGDGRWQMDIDNGVGVVHLTMTIHRLDGSLITLNVFDSGHYMPRFDPSTGMPIGDGPLSDLLNGFQPDFSRMRMRIVDRFEPFMAVGGVQVEVGEATSDFVPLPVDPTDSLGPKSLTYHVGAATVSLPAGGVVSMSSGSYTVTEIRDQGGSQGVHDFGNAVVDGSFDYRMVRSDGTWTGHAHHDKFGPVSFTVSKDGQPVAVAAQSANGLSLETSDGQAIGLLSGF